MWVSPIPEPPVLMLSTALLGAFGCDSVTRFANRDLEFAYQGDSQGGVDRASVDSNTRVIASAQRVAVRSATDPAATEIDVDETHFVRGTLTIVYADRIVFQCTVGETWCLRVREAPVSGTRPRDEFRKWPLRLDALKHGYPL
jgi:hypothetical protein